MIKLKKSIIVIGGISSGKSTIAKYISEKYGIKIASFGEYLNDYSLRNDLHTDRKSLQDLGDKLINSKPEKFLLDVISFSGSDTESLIFEGVRHMVIFDLIKGHSTQSLSIFIDTPYDVRKERYLLRNKDIDLHKSCQEFDARNSHVVEMQVTDLRKLCDLIILSYESDLLRVRLASFLRN